MIFRIADIESLFATRLIAHQLLIELWITVTLTQYQADALLTGALDFHTVNRCAKRHCNLVTLLAAPLDRLKGCTLLTKHIQCFINVSIAQLQRRALDLYLAQVTDHDLRINLECRCIFELLDLFTEWLMLDIRESCNPQLILFDCFCESTFNCIR